MIGPHTHFRDWQQSKKETLYHGLKIAYLAGFDGVFEMPNTAPAITTRDLLERRVELGDKAIYQLEKEIKDFKIFHAVYAGITASTKQIGVMVKAYNDLFPRVVALKEFVGQSTGNMGIIKEEQQKRVPQVLVASGYEGVVSLHCEEESLMGGLKFDHKDPFTHTQARPPQAETYSAQKQIEFYQEAGFKGTLNICHISAPETLFAVEKMRDKVGFKITTELTPHHAMMYDKMMEGKDGLLLKMNPPLRPKEMQEFMFKALMEGRIDWIGTDHAPHTLEDKVDPNKEEPFASGIPGLPYYPKFIQVLKDEGISDYMLDRITHDNIVHTFGIDPSLIPNTKRAGLQNDWEIERLALAYEFDAFEKVR